MKIQFIWFIFVSGMLTSVDTKAQLSSIKPLEINLENYEYPYPVQYITLNIQGEILKMAYMDVPPARANGHTVMLLHGKNFNGAYWGQTAKVLSDKGYRVIIPDQIGFGKSSKPQHIQYSFQLLAQNTKAVLDTLGIQKICVLGHSMGGMVATRFTLMYPERVEKFILENPIGLEDWKVKVPYQPVDKWYQRELKQNYDLLKKYQQENYYHGTWKPEYDEWLKVPAGWTLNKDYNRIAWNSALIYDMIFTQPVCYEFQNIKTPSLLIIGQADRTAIGKNLVSEDLKKTLGNYPVLGKLTHEKIKGSQLIELNGVGHIPHVEAFDRFIQPLLEFLK
ncbi:MAG TPA: alpha/beta hydrolase [Chitinophagaceae bacterium]|jgi:pimeloyl-ACP methyl ester carboxylesterase